MQGKSKKPKRLKIAIDGRTIVRMRSGVGVYAERLVRSLVAHDQVNEYTVFLVEPNEQLSAPNLQKIVYADLLTFFQNRHWENILLARFLKENEIDVFFSPAYILPLLPRLGRYLRWIPLPANLKVPLHIDQKTRYIVTVHDIISTHSPHYFTLKSRFWQHTWVSTATHLADRIIADSICTKNDLIRHFGVVQKRIAVVYPELDRNLRPVRDRKSIDLIRKKYGLSKRYIFSLGTIEPRKNVSGLVRAYTKLPKALQERYSLVIAGSVGWHAEEIAAEIEALSKEYDIRRLDYIAHEDLPSLYSTASLFAYPSFYEGFGYPPLEAMACGTPVITSNTSSLPEAVGNAAILVDPHKVDDIARAMEMVLTNRSLWQTLRSKGLRQAGKFGWKSGAKRTLEVFGEAAAGAQSGAVGV